MVSSLLSATSSAWCSFSPIRETGEYYRELAKRLTIGSRIRSRYVDRQLTNVARSNLISRSLSACATTLCSVCEATALCFHALNIARSESIRISLYAGLPLKPADSGLAYLPVLHL